MSWFAEAGRATDAAVRSVPIEDTCLVGWWKLDEKSGKTAYDSSGHGNRGQLIGGPTWVDGRIGGALNFANTDDTKMYVDSNNLKIRWQY